MQTNPSAEIVSCLEHQDYPLAVRRMLDLSYDIRQPSLMRETIEWSKSYNKANQPKEKESLPAGFLETADQLLAKTEAYDKSEVQGRYNLLKAIQVKKTYRKGNFSLHPMDVQVNTGDIIGIVGENGNGKTTLLRCIAGQLAIDGGSIDLPALQKPDNYTIRHHIAFIPQRIPRWFGLLKDNLHFSASIAGVRGEENLLLVDFMLERFNLSSYANLTWNQISSGYKTRFEIARILLQSPSLLILDEPLANLDINAQQTLLTDLRFMTKSASRPMGVLLSSQQLHEVEKIADAVMLIKQGKHLFTTAAKQNIGEVAIECETESDRDTLIQALEGTDAQVQFNGGYFTITSAVLSAQDLLTRLVQRNISLSYYRDISRSTKRYF